jgi:hypothetical protein
MVFTIPPHFSSDLSEDLFHFRSEFHAAVLSPLFFRRSLRIEFWFRGTEALGGQDFSIDAFFHQIGFNSHGTALGKSLIFSSISHVIGVTFDGDHRDFFFMFDDHFRDVV